MGNSIYVPKDQWRSLIKDWLITDITIRHKELISIVVRQTFSEEKSSLMLDHEFRTNVVQIKLNREPEKERTGAAF